MLILVFNIENIESFFTFKDTLKAFSDFKNKQTNDFRNGLQMVFVPNLYTVKTYMVKTKSNRNLHKYIMNWYNII